MPNTHDLDHPAIIAPPPLIYLGFLALGLFLEWLQPTQLFAGPVPALIGLTLLITGLVGMGLAVRLFYRAHTPVDPYQPPTRVITQGPYRFSRNPIYLFMMVTYIGLAMAFSTVWAILLIPGLIWALQQGVIRREEQYLSSRFGEEYLDFVKRVRRWI